MNQTKPRLFLLSLLLIATANAAWGLNLLQRSIKRSCPTQEDIPKCICKHDSRGLSVVCRSFQEDSDLRSHLKTLLGHPLSKLEIRKYSAASIPTDLWRGQEIEDLSLDSVEVGDASFRRGQRHFQGLESYLSSLEIRNSFKNGNRPLLNLQLDHLKNLKVVIMEGNIIPEVGNDWFATGPEGLSTLIFERNGIEELGDRAFASLSNLRLLAVAGNHLNSISRSMFPESANSLTTLDLAYNKIRTLPTDIFSAMPLLDDVNLNYNLIHMVRQDIWSPVSSQLTSLKLEGNPLQCDEHISWICGTSLRNADGKCSSPREQQGLPLRELCKL